MSDNKRTVAIVGAIIGTIACVGIGISIASKSSEEVYVRELTVQDYEFLSTARDLADIPVEYNDTAAERGRAVCSNINRSDVSIAIVDEQKTDRVEFSPAIMSAALKVYCPEYESFAIKEIEKYYGIR